MFPRKINQSLLLYNVVICFSSLFPGHTHVKNYAFIKHFGKKKKIFLLTKEKKKTFPKHDLLFFANSYKTEDLTDDCQIDYH